MAFAPIIFLGGNITMWLKDQWVAKMTKAIKLSNAYPNKTDIEIRKAVLKMYDDKFKDTNVVIYNDYEEEVLETSLSGTLDWIQSANPILTESGVFFHQKSEMRNVNTEIIKEEMLDARTIHKKEMFEARKAGDVILEMVKYTQQINDKKAANSGYGAEGEPSSFLYNPHSAMSVTASGRGQLSTACQCIENLLADFVKFMNIDEFFTYVCNIISEKDSWRFDVYDVINIIPTKKMFLKRMKNKFKYKVDYDENLISSVWDSLSNEEKIRVYYKSNINDFLLNDKLIEIYANISLCGEDMIDPNDIPHVMLPYINLLTELTNEFVNYKHGIFRYEDRTKNEKRNVTPVMDKLYIA